MPESVSSTECVSISQIDLHVGLLDNFPHYLDRRVKYNHMNVYAIVLLSYDFRMCTIVSLCIYLSMYRIYYYYYKNSRLTCMEQPQRISNPINTSPFYGYSNSIILFFNV